jgi:hypothetical protein
VLQPVGTDAVCSVFVFLHLLKRKTERLTKLFAGSSGP